MLRAFVAGVLRNFVLWGCEPRGYSPWYTRALGGRSPFSHLLGSTDLWGITAGHLVYLSDAATKEHQ